MSDEPGTVPDTLECGIPAAVFNAIYNKTPLHRLNVVEALAVMEEIGEQGYEVAQSE